MPSYFEQRERALLGAEYETLYTAPQAVYRGITVNALRMAPQQLAAAANFAVTPSPFCSAGLLVQDAAVRLGTHPLHHAGAYYVQEPSASAPCDLLRVQPADRVLDTCAAPGGKTSRLAALLAGQGLLVANEFMAQRATVLKSNLERMGVANAVVLNESTDKLAKTFGQFFNKILVDAPCSGEGMFRKEPQAVAQHNEGLVRQCAALGKEILDNAAQCLAPGGLLVYSTCTFAGEENEQQIAAFLQRHADFTLVNADLPFGSAGEARRLADIPCRDIGFTRRIYPCHGGEGQFMALLQKAGTAPAGSVCGKERRAVPMPPVCKAFMQQYFPPLAGKECCVVGDTVYLLPGTTYPSTDKLHVLRAGVQAGEIVKGRFVPAHHLFMAYGAVCTQRLALDVQDARVGAWLHGEEIAANCAENGWVCVTVNGAPLGGGKQNAGRVKNHYPKGLRNLK